MAALIPAQATAQESGDIVMRRPITSDQVNEAAWDVTQWSRVRPQGSTGPWCGSYQEVRQVRCLRQPDGQEIADQFCSNPKPDASQMVTDESGCTYSWRTGDWLNPGEACGNETETRSVICRRDNDDAVVSDEFCTTTRPPSAQVVVDYSACSYSWKSSPWVDPGQNCGPETQERDVTCHRSLDDAVVGDEMCDAGERPESTQEVVDHDSCTYEWKTGGWQDPGNACTAAETQNRTVTCHRSLDDAVVADSFCSTAKPAATQTVADYSTCSHSWEVGAFVDPGAACTASEVQERTVRCKRDLDGATVENGLCNAATRPTSTQSVPDYSACAHSWHAGAWNEGGAACTAAETQTRAISCRRDLDGVTVDDALCNAAQRPAASQQVEDRTGCSYSWVEGGWGAWSSSCSTTANRTQTVSCRRSDGTTVADTFCNAATKPATSQTTPQTSGCSYAADWGAWGAWSSSCSTNASRSRTATCRRSDGTTVANSECTSRGVALTESETGQQLGGCTYSWVEGGWGAWSSACSTAATRTQTVTCRRSDGTTVADASCNAATKPATQQTSEQTGGCSYAANWGAWGGWSSSCSTSASRSRTATCRRSDGTTVGNSECTSRGIALSESETSSQLGGCTYSADWGGWGNWSSSCSTAATRSRSATCRRSDGTAVAAAECTNRGVALSETESSQQLGGCTYSAVNWSGWGAWSSTCSHSATRTQTAQCRRSDGTIVGNAECTSRGVSLTQSESGPVYSGCGYTWDYGTWNEGAASCTASETQTRSVTCRRSIDNAAVADGFCNAGTREASTRSVADYSGCQYAVEPGSWSQCVSGTQSRSVSCRRSDGVLVDASLCGVPSGSQTQNCTYYEWEIGAYGGWSACSNSSQSQTRSVVCRARPAGTAVADDLCPQPTPQRVNTQACSSAPTAETCNTAARGVMAQGPWWTINRPLGAFPNGTFDYTQGIRAYTDQIYGAGKYNAWVWTIEAAPGGYICRNNGAQSTAIMMCEFGLSATGVPANSGYCIAYH